MYKVHTTFYFQECIHVCASAHIYPYLFTLSFFNLTVIQFIKEMDIFVAHFNVCCTQDSEGNTPLHVASQRGSDMIAEFLLEAQVPTDVRNDKNITPVHIAAIRGNLV